MKQVVIILIVLLSMVGTTAYAYEIAVENTDGVTIYYNYVNDGKDLEVTKGEYRYKGTVVIPEEVTYMNWTRKVTSIGEKAFIDCPGLTSVTIPNSVTCIGGSAFYGCPGLISVTIPNSVTSIGATSFQNCSGLTSITIPNSVTTIEDGAFENCYGLTSITIPNSVTRIGNHAFSECFSLTSITIPNSVTTIGYYAFYHCASLTSITIPNSVESIGNMAFGGWDLPVVISLIENPFVINGKATSYRTFSQNTFNNATLYVPVGMIDKYKATDGWSDFNTIVEGVPSGIKGMLLDSDKNYPIYNISGRKLEAPQKGINIINGKKVIMN